MPAAMLMSVMITLVGNYYAQDDSTNNANKNIALYYENWKNSSGKMTYFEYVIDNGVKKTIIDKDIQVDQNKTCVKYKELNRTQGGTERVYCINENYAFVIEKNKKDWVIEEILNADDLKKRKYFQILEFIVYPNKYIEGYDVSMLCNNSVIKIISVDQFNIESSKPYIGSNPILPKFDSVQCAMQSGRLEKYKMLFSSGDNQVTVDAFYEYGNNGNAFIPRKINRVQRWHPKNSGKIDNVSNAELVFDYGQSKSNSNEIYYLSYYGLPEPPGVNPLPRSSPIPWYAYAAAFGIICLIAAWFIKRQRPQVKPV
jgi:hypothetical protein